MDLDHSSSLSDQQLSFSSNLQTQSPPTFDSIRPRPEMSQKRAPRDAHPAPSSIFPPLAAHHRLPLQRNRISALNKLDLDTAFFWLLLVFLLTVFAFLSLRDPHIQLNPHQVAEYERRSQFLSNSTVYIVEVNRPEGLLQKLSAKDWARISSDIDFVAFVFDDLPLFLTDDWVAAAERALLDRSLPSASRVAAGIGIALFPCGCVLPNAYFTRVDHRLGGYECLLLPGWVLPHEDVHWLDVRDETAPESCRRRDGVLAARLTARYRKELKEIHAVLDTARQEADEGKVSRQAPQAGGEGSASRMAQGASGAVAGREAVAAVKR